MTEARLAQKRARDKEYHLRKRGAAMVGDQSPRMQWAEVKDLSTKELRRYTKRLTSFNAIRSTVLESGEVIPEKVLRQINKNIRTHNRKAAAERRKIDKVQSNLPSVGEKFIQSRASVGVDPNTMKPYISVEAGATGSTLQPIVATEPPRNARAAYRRLEESRKWAFPNYTKRLSSQRGNLVTMLERAGLDDVANDVQGMSSLALSVAINRYGIFDDVNLWYMPDSSAVQAQIGYNQQDYDLFASRMRELVSGLRNV